MRGVFETNFRSAHEPERAELLAKVVSLDERLIDGDEMDDFLRERDERLQLELDTSWANYFIMDRLAVLFPNAKFIQLVRDCYTWVESLINHLVTRAVPPDVQGFMDWWFEPTKYPHQKEDRTLREAGMYSLECYLTRWTNQVEGPSRVIPPDRLLVIRTHEIPESLGAMALFLGVPPDQLDKSKTHSNRGKTERPLLTLVDRGYLEDTVGRVCRETMSRYFPEVKGVKDAFTLVGKSVR